MARRDWRAVHDQPVVLAETFVDHARFSGLFYLHPHTLHRSHMVIIIPEPDEACCEKSHRRTVKYSQIEGPIQADSPATARPTGDPGVWQDPRVLSAP